MNLHIINITSFPLICFHAVSFFNLDAIFLLQVFDECVEVVLVGCVVVVVVKVRQHVVNPSPALGKIPDTLESLAGYWALRKSCRNSRGCLLYRQAKTENGTLSQIYNLIRKK